MPGLLADPVICTGDGSNSNLDQRVGITYVCTDDVVMCWGVD